MSLARIPLDIWELIFCLCLPDDVFIQPSSKLAPLLLCQINNDWRSYALSLPALWSSLAVKISRRGCRPQLPLIHPWLARAARHPLYISLTLDGRPGVHAYTNTDAALRNLIPSFPSWKRVLLRVGPFLSLSTLLLLPSQQPSLLEDLEIFLPTTFEEATEQVSYIFKCAPRLRRLTIATEFLERSVPQIKVPFWKLTFLHLQSSMFTLDDCLEVLAQCRSLIIFKYHDMWGRFERTRTGPPILLQDLQVLSLSTSSTEMNVFFDSLTLPSLAEVTIHGIYPFPAHNFLSLTCRSSCSLTTLRLYLPMLENELTDCLKAVTSSLKVLDVNTNDGCITDRVLQSLTVDDTTTSCLCPKLEVLGFGLLSTSDGVLSAMIESRCLEGRTEVVPLERVDLNIITTHTEDLSRLGMLKSKGLDVRMFDHPGDERAEL